MDLQKELLREYSKENTFRIAEFIDKDSEKMQELMNFYSGKNELLAIRSAWVMSHVHDLHPTQTDKYQNTIISTLKKTGCHDAIKRAGLRTLAEKVIEEENLGELADLCFQFLNKREDSIAVKVHSMEILKNIVLQVPELKDELIFSLEEQFEFQSKGFQSRAKKILVLLKNNP